VGRVGAARALLDRPTPMKSVERLVRHARIVAKNYEKSPSPPFLILFINSICNQRCEHCFYWSNLNRKDDLTKEELFKLSDELGRIENLNLSRRALPAPGLQRDLPALHPAQQGAPDLRATNSYFKDRMLKHISATLEERELELFVVEMSLDGLGEFHDTFRGSPGSFRKAIETYDALEKLQEQDRACASTRSPPRPRSTCRRSSG